MKVTIKKVTMKNGEQTLRIETSEFDQHMVNWLKKWGARWNPERKCWYVREDIDAYQPRLKRSSVIAGSRAQAR